MSKDVGPLKDNAALSALSDQVKASCDNSSLDVIGFVLVIDQGEGVGAEFRGRIDDEEWGHVIKHFAAEWDNSTQQSEE